MSSGRAATRSAATAGSLGHHCAFSQLPTFASLPGYAGTRSRSLAITVACGSRTTSIVLHDHLLARRRLRVRHALRDDLREPGLRGVLGRKRAERHGEALRADVDDRPRRRCPSPSRRRRAARLRRDSRPAAGRPRTRRSSRCAAASGACRARAARDPRAPARGRRRKAAPIRGRRRRAPPPSPGPSAATCCGVRSLILSGCTCSARRPASPSRDASRRVNAKNVRFASNSRSTTVRNGVVNAGSRAGQILASPAAACRNEGIGPPPLFHFLGEREHAFEHEGVDDLDRRVEMHARFPARRRRPDSSGRAPDRNRSAAASARSRRKSPGSTRSRSRPRCCPETRWNSPVGTLRPAVFSASACSMSRIPGRINPPWKTPFTSSASIVTAVPALTTTHAGGNSSVAIERRHAATSDAQRSAPSCAGRA